MKYFLFSLFLIACLSVFSQKSEIYELNWQKPLKEIIGSETLLFLNFSGASYNDKLLPDFSFRDAIPVGMKVINAQIFNAEFIPLTEEEQAFLKNPEAISTEIILNTDFQIERKKPYTLFSVVPLKRNSSGTIEKLSKFSLSYSLAFTKENDIAKFKVLSNVSVLNTGKWVKLKLNESGIYRISYSELISMGFSNPGNISVFSNGGGMLPLRNSDFRHDDLVQNSISFEDVNSDGSFNSNDYILFYGQSSHNWGYDSTKGMFIHTKHRYSDYSYCFLTDSKPVKIINSVNSLPSGNVNVSTFDDYNFYERDSLNLINSGSVWYGSCFDIVTTYNYYFNFPDIYTSLPLKAKIAVAARSSSISNYSVSINGQNQIPLSVSSVNINSYTNSYAADGFGYYSVSPQSNNNTIRLSYNKPNSSSIGWLNYITVNARRYLKMSSSQLYFRDINSVGAGKIATYTITNAGSNLKVWDVTNPVNAFRILPASYSDGTFVFHAAADSLRQFVAFNDASFLSPVRVGDVTNQNLHALENVDMVIISHPDFKSYADQLATHHRAKDNFSVVVATPEEVYNEFSSGMPDVAAVRDFMRMLYDKAGTDDDKMPRYLLLYGDGSYDNFSNSSSNTNYILTYQSGNSLDPTQSYVCDDFYTLLDYNEGTVAGSETMDIGVGRLPVKTQSEAKLVLDKILNYTSTATFGDWRNVLTFVGDDAEDVTSHQTQTDYLANVCDTLVPNYNIDKIYLDAFQQVSTPVGERYPDVNIAILNRIRKGTLVFNYTGHGNELGLAHEHVVTTSDIASWDNWNKLPVFITATCEFSRYDDPVRTSAGEQVLLSTKGGAIAMFSTSRLVYSTPNFYLNQSFYDYMFAQDNNGETYRLGDVMRLAKNSPTTTASINKRNFVLLGDPALQIAIPYHNVVTTHINGATLSLATDTFKALSKITVSGKIVDRSGSIVSDFNGIIYPAVYDKPMNTSTHGNDGNAPLNYRIQNKVLYKGKATVRNGEFSFTFIVPKDISYTIGKGKISYYADNSQLDAAGNYREVMIGGSSSNFVNDSISPELKLFMNDENFVFGGITDPNPCMIANIIDSSGVNTVGNGIGHDITAVIDGNTSKALNLNDYYEAELDSYQKGKVSYDFTNLSVGNHNLRLKVWDVNNNSAEAYLEFIVASSAELVLDHIFNYPNPFTTQTSFYFDHNQPNSDLEVLVQIFTVTGKLVKTLDATMNTAGFRSTPVLWDGLDDFGDKIGKGVYIYKLKVKPVNGKLVEKFEKLVILK